MASAFSLQALLDQARHRMEASERLLLMIRHKEEAAKQKLEELQNYRFEYQGRLTGNTQGGMDILLLRDYYAFLAKLEQAIKFQEREVDQQHARWMAAHASWLELRQKVKSYEVLKERHIRAETKRHNIREQRQSDEFAGRKAAVKTTDGHS